MAKLTLTELKTLLDQTGLPVYYSRQKLQSTDVTTTDFIIYSEVSELNKLDGSDETIWKTKSIQVSLFTKDKDETIENNLAGLLTGAKIQYEVITEDYDVEARLQQRIYEFELDVF